jgi:hypothetical protein
MRLTVRRVIGFILTYGECRVQTAQGIEEESSDHDRGISAVTLGTSELAFHTSPPLNAFI